MCQHRLPYIGHMQVIEQYECYFKIEISMPFKQLKKEESLLIGQEEEEDED